MARHGKRQLVGRAYTRSRRIRLGAIALTWFWMFGPTAGQADEAPIPHYCDDAAGWQQWSELVQRYPEDDDLAVGFALRIGLCQQVKAGTIDTARAIRLFDRYLDALQKQAEAKANQEQVQERETDI